MEREEKGQPGRSDQEPCGSSHCTSMEEAFQVGVKKKEKQDVVI